MLLVLTKNVARIAVLPPSSFSIYIVVIFCTDRTSFIAFVDPLCRNGLLPSTSDVSRVTLAAFLRPAGSASPIRSSLSRKNLPPFLDFALEKEQKLVHDINVFESLISSARRNGLVEISENAKMTGA